MPASHEKQVHQGRIVAALALQCHMPVPEMASLYEHERAGLALGAHVTSFLHIFATHNVLEVVRKRGLDKPAPTLSSPAMPVA